jgi:hypothetical protein
MKIIIKEKLLGSVEAPTLRVRGAPNPSTKKGILNMLPTIPREALIETLRMRIRGSV